MACRESYAINHFGDIRGIPPGNNGQQAHREPMIRFKAPKIMRGATMNVYYFDLSNEPASLPLEALLASLSAKGVELDIGQIVADLNTKGWHRYEGIHSTYSIVRSF
jgi:hypothetical protein